MQLISGCCIYTGETLRRRAITIRRKLRVRAKQTSHVRADEFDVDKEFELQEEYKKQLEEFSFYKIMVWAYVLLFPLLRNCLCTVVSQMPFTCRLHISLYQCSHDDFCINIDEFIF